MILNGEKTKQIVENEVEKEAIFDFGTGEMAVELFYGAMLLFGGSLLIIFLGMILFSGRPLDSFNPTLIYLIILADGLSIFILLYYIICSKILSDD